jgi:uncharacterized membrane protein
MANNPKKENSKYKYGIFYFNGEDENLIVQKPDALLGWTLNFAKPLAYILVMIGFLLLMLILKLF